MIANLANVASRCYFFSTLLSLLGFFVNAYNAFATLVILLSHASFFFTQIAINFIGHVVESFHTMLSYKIYLLKII